MSTGNRYHPAVITGKFRQIFAPAEALYIPLAGNGKLGIVFRGGRSKNQRIDRSIDIIFPVSGKNLRSGILQCTAFGVEFDIRTADFHAALQKQFSQRSHAGSADTGKVNFHDTALFHALRD